MDSLEVLAKKEAAVRWCVNASEYPRTWGGKAWQYLLFSHDSIAENMTSAGLKAQITISVINNPGSLFENKGS